MYRSSCLCAGELRYILFIPPPSVTFLFTSLFCSAFFAYIKQFHYFCVNIMTSLTFIELELLNCPT